MESMSTLYQKTKDQLEVVVCEYKTVKEKIDVLLERELRRQLNRKAEKLRVCTYFQCIIMLTINEMYTPTVVDNTVYVLFVSFWKMR